MGSGSGLVSGIPDLTTILNNIGTVMSAIDKNGGVLTSLAGLVGVFFIFQSLRRMGMVAQDSSALRGGTGEGQYIFVPLFFGVLFLNFWATQQSITDTFGLSGGVLSPATPTPYLQQLWSAMVTVLHGFGYIAIFRGLLLLKGAGDGTVNGHHSPVWGGFWHILGGALLINL